MSTDMSAASYRESVRHATAAISYMVDHYTEHAEILMDFMELTPDEMLALERSLMDLKGDALFLEYMLEGLG